MLDNKHAPGNMAVLVNAIAPDLRTVEAVREAYEARAGAD
jgi:hypothetical protein